MLLQNRFSDTSADGELHSENGIRAIEKMTWLRWLFFVLGTLRSAIKLMAMSGVPWTKALGMMFLSSFLLVEILVISSGIIQRGSARESTPRAERIHIMRILEFVEMFLIVVAILLQVFAF